MEPLHRLFKKAQEIGLLHKLSKGCDAFRMLLYADDVAVFINPTEHDLALPAKFSAYLLKQVDSQPI
jgi:hypothetical protein